MQFIEDDCSATVCLPREGTALPGPSRLGSAVPHLQKGSFSRIGSLPSLLRENNLEQ
jgi:hypothetical protein